MADNTVKTEDGAEIYIDAIDYYIDQYIEELKQSPKHIEDKNYIFVIEDLKNKTTFKRLLKYIYKNVFKISSKEVKYNNKNSNFDYNNTILLNDLWDKYTDICYKYGQAPTLFNFSLFTGISYDTLHTWKNGEYRSGSCQEGQGATPTHSDIVKKWAIECEGNLYDLAMTGNPGPMFLLKSKYGYVEAPQQVQIIGGKQPEQIAADIAARHMISQTEPPKLPEDL